MTAFQRIFETERLAAEAVVAAPRRRRLAAQAIHAAAERELGRFWHELSKALCHGPVPVIDDMAASLIDCGPEALHRAAESLHRILIDRHAGMN